jgi:NADH-quinone oxidoreductase subunit N
VLASVAVLYAVLGLYYYMKIASAMFMRPAADTEPVTMSMGLRLALAVTGIATLGIGIFPEMFIRAAGWSLGIAATNSPVIGLLR